MLAVCFPLGPLCMLRFMCMAFAKCQIKMLESGVACTYIMVCITKCLGLLIHSVRIDRIVIFTIGKVRLCGLVDLMIWGSMVRAARWFVRCWIAWFALEGHNIIGVNRLGG